MLEMKIYLYAVKHYKFEETTLKVCLFWYQERLSRVYTF